MRILSQEGREAFYDFPYDKCLVYIYGDKKTIKIQALGEVDSDYVMATYSTEEKVSEVMKKLQKQYLDYTCNYNSKCAVFRFPKDEEVEL